MTNAAVSNSTATSATYNTTVRCESCALSMRDVSFTYAGAIAPVLSHVTWNVPTGAFALMVGSTGSGKSTLLKLLKSQITPAGERVGAVEVSGHAVDDLSDAESARMVGYVFQDPENQMVCDTVAAEIAFGLENLGVDSNTMHRRIAEICYFFGLDQWFHDPIATLSGGRKQLLALASVLSMRPRLLVLDEPTAQLDPIAEKSFLHALFRANRELGCTVVVATHRPQPMIDYATCAFKLVDGHVETLDRMSKNALMIYPKLLDKASVASTVFEVPSSLSNHKSAFRSAAELQGVWFRYTCEAPWVLKGLDTNVLRGTITALVGGNGSGKSTILKTLAGITKPQRGRVRHETRTRALLPQDPKALFVAETVEAELMEWAHAAGYTRDDAMAKLEQVGLARTLIERHPYDLSGGEQQLLSLAKVLLIKPELLLLDEPTKGLDTAARRIVARILSEEAAQGTAVVMASHDLDFVEQVAHQVAMVFDGEFTCMAPTQEFFEDNVYYRP